MKKRLLWLLGMTIIINWYVKNTLATKSKLYAQSSVKLSKNKINKRHVSN